VGGALRGTDVWQEEQNKFVSAYRPAIALEFREEVRLPLQERGT